MARLFGGERCQETLGTGDHARTGISQLEGQPAAADEDQDYCENNDELRSHARGYSSMLSVFNSLVIKRAVYRSVFLYYGREAARCRRSSVAT